MEKFPATRAITVPIVIASITGALAACDGPGVVTVHGTVTPSSASASVFGPGMTSTSYAGCSAATPTPGTQVTVTDSSGKVLGVGTLGAWSSATASVSGTTIYPCTMPFTITGVTAGEVRYGFAISGVPGTQWETNVKNVALQVTGGS